MNVGVGVIVMVAVGVAVWVTLGLIVGSSVFGRVGGGSLSGEALRAAVGVAARPGNASVHEVNCKYRHSSTKQVAAFFIGLIVDN